MMRRGTQRQAEALDQVEREGRTFKDVEEFDAFLRENE
jgi:hypothetical protein